MPNSPPHDGSGLNIDGVFSTSMSRLYESRGEATDAAAEVIAQQFGRGEVDGKIQAHIVTVAR